MQAFETIACVEFDGIVTKTGQSMGHYRCFVKDFSNQQWVKTNDDKDPQVVRVEDVTKLGYVILLRRHERLCS